MKLSSGLLALRRVTKVMLDRWRYNIASANQRLKFQHNFVNLSKHLNGFSGPKARWLLFNCTRWRHRFSEILGTRSSATQVGFQMFKISAFDWSKTFLKTEFLRAASSNASWNWNININPENEKLRAEGGFSNSCFWLAYWSRESSNQNSTMLI